jgi:hypothetical protein
MVNATVANARHAINSPSVGEHEGKGTICLFPQRVAKAPLRIRAQIRALFGTMTVPQPQLLRFSDDDCHVTTTQTIESPQTEYTGRFSLTSRFGLVANV